jgi:organic radical activating enzyme
VFIACGGQRDWRAACSAVTGLAASRRLADSEIGERLRKIGQIAAEIGEWEYAALGIVVTGGDPDADDLSDPLLVDTRRHRALGDRGRRVVGGSPRL